MGLELVQDGDRSKRKGLTVSSSSYYRTDKRPAHPLFYLPNKTHLADIFMPKVLNGAGAKSVSQKHCLLSRAGTDFYPDTGHPLAASLRKWGCFYEPTLRIQ